jgi:hypothetical protein
MRKLRSVVPLILFAVFSICNYGCHPKPSLVIKESSSFLTQDRSKLKDTNGTIVEQRGFWIESGSGNGMDCHRIVYLVSQAKNFGERMRALGKPHELVIFPNGDHGLNNP